MCGGEKRDGEKEEEEEEAGAGYVDPLVTAPIHAQLESLCDDEGHSTRPFLARALCVRE